MLELDWWPSNDSSYFESEYGKNLQVRTINTQYNISDINNISLNKNVCENEVSVLSTDESDWWPPDDSSYFESEYGKNLQVGTINTQYNVSDINNISLNKNVCENEVSVLSTDESDWWPPDDSSYFESEYGKNLQVGTINTQYNVSDINNISLNKNVCENEVSVLSTDESDSNQVSDSSETFLDPFAILKEVRKKILIGP